jgi:hypothetical protein
MTPEIRKMEEQVRQLQKDIEAAKNEYADANNPVKKVADIIHKLTCAGNHVDYCGWEYEGVDHYLKPGTTRNGYYVRAEKIVQGEKVAEVLRILTKLHTTR